MRMQLMMQLQMHNAAMQQMQQLMMGGNPMTLMGGNFSQNNVNSGGNTPNDTQQSQAQAKSQPQTRPYRSPPKQPAAMAKQKQSTSAQAESDEKANSKRKHDEIADGIDGADDSTSVAQSEERATKQVKTQ